MTGAQALELIAKQTGIPAASLARIARSLREAGQDFWPSGKQGGGKGAALVEPRHLACLFLAVGQGAITTAAEAALSQISLPSQDAPSSIPEEVPDSLRESLLFLSRSAKGKTALEFISEMIDWLATPDGLSFVHRLIESGSMIDVTIKTWSEHRSVIEVFYRHNHGIMAGRVAGFGGVAVLTPEQFARVNAHPAAIVEIRILSVNFLFCLATCWVSTKSRRGVAGYPSSSDGGSLPEESTPENETPNLPGSGASKSPKLTSGHPQACPNTFETRRDGKRASGDQSRGTRSERRSSSPLWKPSSNAQNEQLALV